MTMIYDPIADRLTRTTARRCAPDDM